MNFEELEAAFDQYEIANHEAYNIEDKLHRLISILPQDTYHQLSMDLPSEGWKYEALKAKIVEVMNIIAFRRQAHDAVNQGRVGGIFNMEHETGGCEEGCDCEKQEFGGYGVNTYEEINLFEHVKQGKAGFDKSWNVVSEQTTDALYKAGKRGGGKGGKKGEGDIVCYNCGRKGQMKAECRSTTILGFSEWRHCSLQNFREPAIRMVARTHAHMHTKIHARIHAKLYANTRMPNAYTCGCCSFCKLAQPNPGKDQH